MMILQVISPLMEVDYFCPYFHAINIGRNFFEKIMYKNWRKEKRKIRTVIETNDYMFVEIILRAIRFEVFLEMFTQMDNN